MKKILSLVPFNLTPVVIASGADIKAILNRDSSTFRIKTSFMMPFIALLLGITAVASRAAIMASSYRD